LISFIDYNFFNKVLFACWHSIIGSQLFEDFELTSRKNIDSYVLAGFAIAFVIYTIIYASWVIRMQKVVNIKKLNKK
jgi:hypothetical protein